MKKIILSLMVVLCATYANAQGFLIDNTIMYDWNPVIPTYTEYQTTRSNGDKFNGQQERTNGNVTGYRGTLTKRDGSYYYGLFDAYFRPIRGGWYVKNNTLYYNIYENGVAVNTERVETGGRKFFFLDNGRNSLRFYEDSYSSSDYNYNNGSSNSSNNSSSSQGYQRSNTVSRSDCKVCNGTGRIKRSVPITSGFGTETHYKYCNECGETMGASRHIHINCPHCR
ncbi:MAG: hypothetical protein IJ277_01255 [Bacteroidaceae bacterium]|nr:hypothetical protein [Bacteroidaceae bacterium]